MRWAGRCSGEPVVTVLLAFLVFGETLVAVQLAGGALVLAAVPVLHVRRRPLLRAVVEPVRSQ
jgi:drug/metabolite transporter (DMT)-like permease